MAHQHEIFNLHWKDKKMFFGISDFFVSLFFYILMKVKADIISNKGMLKDISIPTFSVTSESPQELFTGEGNVEKYSNLHWLAHCLKTLWRIFIELQKLLVTMTLWWKKINSFLHDKTFSLKGFLIFLTRAIVNTTGECVWKMQLFSFLLPWEPLDKHISSPKYLLALCYPDVPIQLSAVRGTGN